MREVTGSHEAKDLKIGIVVARWNQSITGRLLDGALQRLDELGAEDVTVLRVPGALEIPVGARALAERGHDAIVVIGVVIKGETDHYDIVVSQSTSGVSRVSLDTGIPVGNAILAVHDVEDAIARSESGQSNKGREAVDAAIETATALRAI
ncbi:MAG: 6,7-dimethyl-8-ribityllumazine synthase [Actinobacteria bacterium]|nr:MAG: 6,7-dimethyl-8-ribityllumazine synthase [Actinomycetota bacterium]